MNIAQAESLTEQNLDLEVERYEADQKLYAVRESIQMLREAFEEYEEAREGLKAALLNDGDWEFWDREKTKLLGILEFHVANVLGADRAYYGDL